MSEEDTVPDLYSVARKFRQWRAQYRWKHYPKDLWEDAYRLVAKHPLKLVARTLAVQPHHLRQRMKAAIQCDKESSLFVEILPHEAEQHQRSHVEVCIQRDNNLKMAVKFEGSAKELLPIVESLFCGKKSP